MSWLRLRLASAWAWRPFSESALGVSGNPAGILHRYELFTSDLKRLTYIFRMVDSQEKLDSFLPVLRGATWVAVDTEADSLHAYPEKVCLIQISTAHGDRLIDPLSGVNLDLLLDALTGHELIMHGADYDLRLLRKHHEFVPSSIFDTMLAARLLGIRQFSLSHLVEKYLDVKLEKGPQKANWAMRPLTQRMEHYARNDTHYLKPLADHMKPELESRSRLSWHQESCARMISESSKDRLPDMDSVWRVRGSHLLSRHGLSVLREIWRWREREAVAANKPPFFVLGHELLVGIAAAAANSGEVEPLLPKHLSERRRKAILNAVARGLDVSPDHHPGVLRGVSRRPTDGEKRRFQDLRRRRDVRAAELGLDPTLISSRSMLSDLAHDWEKYSPLLMKWQRELLCG